MALVMSFRSGEDFYVGDEQFFVDEVTSAVEVTIRSASTGARFKVSDTRATEILPGVFASAGNKPQAMLARITIEAPREILVVRGDKKRNPPADIKARAGK